MELSELKKREIRQVDADFNGLPIKVNANAITGRHFQLAAERIKEVEAAERAQQKKQIKITEKRLRLQEEIAALATDLENASESDRPSLSDRLADLQIKLEGLRPSTIEVFEGRGRETETICDLYAALIKGSEEVPLLLSWDLTHEGEPVACTVEELRKRHPELLKDLYGCCVEAGRPKLPEIPETATSRTISDSTVAITPSPDTPTDASLTM